MKFNVFLLTVIFGVFSFSSCKKSTEDPTPTPPSGNPGFTCNINGTAWTADSAVWYSNPTQTFIMAYKGGYGQFEINLAGVTATTYTIAPGANDFIYWPSATSFSGGNSGSIIISNYDNAAAQLTGTFGPIPTAGPGGTFTITNGVFTKIPKR